MRAPLSLLATLALACSSPSANEPGETSGDGDGDGDSTSATTDTTDTTTSTGDGDGDGDGDVCFVEGLGDDACQGDDLWCVDGQCVPCSDAGGDEACLALTTAGDVCNAGVCVECTPDNSDACQGDTPVCDPTDFTCVPCSRHDQCSGSACNFITGACFDDTKVFYVDGDDGSDANDGSSGAPFETISFAIDQVPTGEDWVIFVEATVGDYADTIGLSDGGRAIAFLGSGLPVIDGTPTVGANISAGATAFIDGFQFSDANGSGVECGNGTFFLDNSIVFQNAGDGILIGSSCDATVRNSFVTGHTGLGSMRHEVNNAGTLSISYSSLAGSGGISEVVTCTGGTTSISDSIVVSATTSLDCAGATVSRTAINNSSFSAENDNRNPGPLDPNWFVNFVGGALHLAGDGSPADFGGLAVPQPGDLLTDFDDQTRPNPGFVGADEPG